MGTLPQLIEDDIQQLDAAMRELLTKSDATAALVLDKGGFLIANAGEARQFDTTTIAALASGAFAANQTIAGLVQEENFNSVYQQGENFSMLVMDVDEHCLLLTIFPARVGVGIVKYYATTTCASIAEQMQLAQQRDPNATLDLSVLNAADTSDFFRRKV
jgi:predicted regulator of Ras-like GTPase activity (Roadblock/LC7/MglB family)